jgi:hypothetical protein
MRGGGVDTADGVPLDAGSPASRRPLALAFAVACLMVAAVYYASDAAGSVHNALLPATAGKKFTLRPLPDGDANSTFFPLELEDVDEGAAEEEGDAAATGAESPAPAAPRNASAGDGDEDEAQDDDLFVDGGDEGGEGEGDSGGGAAPSSRPTPPRSRSQLPTRSPRPSASQTRSRRPSLSAHATPPPPEPSPEPEPSPPPEETDDGRVHLTSSITMRRATWRRLNRKLACFARGRWEHNPSMADIGPRVSLPDGGVPPEAGMAWQWQTRHGDDGRTEEDCSPLPRWNRADFCGVLRGRSVLVLGDSLSRQFHVALQDLAQRIKRTPKGGKKEGLCPGNGRGKPCGGHTLCTGSGSGGGHAATMVFRRSDHLRLNVTKFSWSHSENAIHEPWQGLMGRQRFDVVVLNRGAHFQHDAQYMAGWRAVLRWLRGHYPNTLVIVRNTPHGHKNCAGHSVPLPSPPPTGDLPYNWDKFPRQNRKLGEMVAAEFPGVVLLDVATPTSMRPDMHRLGSAGKDCLHYREPRGPIDHWVRLLYAALWLVDSLDEGPPPALLADRRTAAVDGTGAPAGGGDALALPPPSPPVAEAAAAEYAEGLPGAGAPAAAAAGGMAAQPLPGTPGTADGGVAE